MYNPTPWKDHVTNPSNCFNITKNDDGTYQITRAGTVMQQGTPQDAAHFTNQEDGIWELFACYGLLLNYARQMGWDVERGSINLTNTAKPYPFNNSQKTVALQMQRPSRDYIVITEASNVKGNLGQIEVSDQLSNGSGSLAVVCCGVWLPSASSAASPVVVSAAVAGTSLYWRGGMSIWAT